MTEKHWKQQSSKLGLARSAELLRIDIALHNYNEARREGVEERQRLLQVLLGQVHDWQESKPDWEVSPRAGAITVLKQRARSELDELSARAQHNQDNHEDARLAALFDDSFDDGYDTAVDADDTLGDEEDARYAGLFEDDFEELGEEQASPDFSVAEQLLEVLDLGTEFLAFQGTDGKDNAGFQNYYNDTSAHLFNALTPGGSGAKDITSGAADIENAIGGLEADVIAVISAYHTLRNPNSSPKEKAEAKWQLAQTPTSVVSNVMVMVGGAMTAARGNGAELASSNFGFTADGVDVSTDVKMAGDFAGLITGLIGTIQKAVDLVKFIGSGGKTDEKAAKRTTRKDLEAVGNLIRKYTGTVASLAGNYKAVTKLGYQIAGGGQKAASAAGAGAMANLGGLVPGLQLVASVMGAGQRAWKLIRIGVRRTTLTDRLKTLVDTETLDGVEAVEFAHESLVKRTTRLAITLTHDVASILAGSFNLSGIGMAPGMAVKITSSLGQLIQVGLRIGKQAGRNRKAEQRAGKAENSEDSFDEWRLRKQLQAAEIGKLQQFLTAIDVAFTFNWDKTTDKKKAKTSLVAQKLLELDDQDIFRALGVKHSLAVEQGEAKRRDIVIAALKRRD